MFIHMVLITMIRRVASDKQNVAARRAQASVSAVAKSRSRSDNLIIIYLKHFLLSIFTSWPHCHIQLRRGTCPCLVSTNELQKISSLQKKMTIW